MLCQIENAETPVCLSMPQENYVRKQVSDCLERNNGGKREGGMPKGYKQTLGVMDKLIILLVVTVTWIYTYFKTQRSFTLNTICAFGHNSVIPLKRGSFCQ